MHFISEFKDKIFRADKTNFEKLALELFDFQSKHIPVYRQYLQNLNIDTNKVQTINDIRFLPISFFKTHKVNYYPASDFYFQSSGTSQMERSKHYINDLNFYQINSRRIFESFYGSIQELQVLALLPSYQENTFSSLLFMVDYLMQNSFTKTIKYFQSKDLTPIYDAIIEVNKLGKSTLLIGVTHALLEVAKEIQWQFPELLVMETGGMKGRGEELVRKEVHDILKTKFGTEHIHSEYGMTELLSQAYAFREGIFSTPPWMQIYIRQINDPYTFIPSGMIGGINIIDLANIESCAFIETQDLGKKYEENTFEVLGRIDHSEIRGCNLMATL